MKEKGGEVDGKRGGKRGGEGRSIRMLYHTAA